MSTSTHSATLDAGREAAVELSASAHEPSWLRDLRLEAWDRYQASPLPTQRDEAWKRTSLAGLDLRTVVPARPSGTAPAETAEALPRELRAAVRVASDVAGLLAQQDGTTLYRTLQSELAGRGVVLTDLASAVREQPALVRDHLGQMVNAGDGKFQALNLALWCGGTFVHVPKGVAVALPLQTIQAISAADLGLFPRTLLVVEETAEVVLVEEYTSSGRQGQPVVSAVAEIFAGRGSRVRYVSVEQWGHDAWHFATIRAKADRDARVVLLTTATGGRLLKQNVDAVLAGDGSEAELIGLMFGDQGQHFDSYTLQDHIGSHTRSDLLFKVALRDRASSNFTGLVRVNKESTKTDANQENRNLLLSDRAKADSDPKLEILNSDVVRCSHGATVGPVEQESLYYLMTRGLPQADAEHLLVEGFFEPVIARVPVEGLRKKLWTAVRRKLDA